MVVGLLWIVGSYGSCIIMLHVVHYLFYRKARSKPTHYVLMTRNNQLQIEWYIRSLCFVMWLKGKDVKITIYDQDSTDDTLTIVERLNDERQGLINIWPASCGFDSFMAEHESEPMIVVRLNNEKELIKIPLPH